MFKVMLVSGGCRKEFTDFETEAEAESFCRECGWEWLDEHDFLWDMTYEEEEKQTANERKARAMKYREIRKITSGDLRNLCMKNNWYTCGNVIEYDHLLYDMADHKENLTTADIVEIAEDIMKHSNMVNGETITSTCFEVARIAYTFFEEVIE